MKDVPQEKRNTQPGIDQTKQPIELYVKKSLQTYITVVLGVLLYLLKVLISVLLNNYLIRIDETLHTYVPMVFNLLSLGLIIFVIYKFSQSNRVLVQVFETKMIVARKLPFRGKINALISMVKIARNTFQKVEIPYNQMDSITTAQGFLSNGIEVTVTSEAGSRQTIPVAIDLLDTSDFNKLINLLKSKGVAPIDV